MKHLTYHEKEIYISSAVNGNIYIEFSKRCSDEINEFIKNTEWLKWNNKRKTKSSYKWYLIVRLDNNKEERLNEIAKIICVQNDFFPILIDKKAKAIFDEHFRNYAEQKGNGKSYFLFPDEYKEWM